MKIFGIGLERTGTTSLAAAMARIGFTACHLPRTTNQIDEVDFSDDITVACRFVDLDLRYPGSKFILTMRDESAWLDSCRRWYGHLAAARTRDYTAEDAARRLYGAEIFDPEAWLEGRRRHEDFVRRYFIERPWALLMIDICGGQGWAQLLPFVADAMPCFPCENAFSMAPVEAAPAAASETDLTAML